MIPNISEGSETDWSPELERIVNAHETTLGLIRTVDATIEKRPVQRGGQFIRSIERWVKRGSLEKYSRDEYIAGATPDEPITLSTTIQLDYATKVMRHLRYPSDLDLGSITPEDQKGLRGQVAPFDRNLVEVQVYSYLLLRLALNARDERRTLRELITECEKCELIGTLVIDGRECLEVDVTHRGVAGRGQGEHMHVFVDPSANYLIRKIVIDHLSPTTNESTNPEVQSQYVAQVLEFRDVGEGVFFPVESETYSITKDNPRYGEKRFTVTALSINEPVAESKVAFEFPPNTLVWVHDEPVTPLTKILFPKFELIGSNGVAIRSFASDGDELKAFFREQRIQASQTNGIALPGDPADDLDNSFSPSDSGAEIAATAVFLVIGAIVAAYFWRRRRG
jgi:hypothetical protein